MVAIRTLFLQICFEKQKLPIYTEHFWTTFFKLYFDNFSDVSNSRDCCTCFSHRNI